VYLVDLTEWSRFNTVYERSMPAPLPVRTAVQAVLLDGFRVEIEMWAVKPSE
jgi:enamine deaminase RidA (YjgF/YER057c/UK114 family)